MLVSLTGDVIRNIPHYFKFERVWVFEKSYQDMLKLAWDANSSFKNNLEELKIQATKWNMHTVKIVHKERKKIMGNLRGIQKAIQDGRSHEGRIALEKTLQYDLEKIMHQEELIWYQRYKKKWLVEIGTLCSTMSKYFKGGEGRSFISSRTILGFGLRMLEKLRECSKVATITFTLHKYRLLCGYQHLAYLNQLKRKSYASLMKS